MRITMLSRHGCFRVTKEALPLIKRGHEVHLLTNKVTQGSEYFNTVTVYQSTDQLYDAIKFYAPHTDIFHAHNEPSWFVTCVKDLNLGKPIVLDIHDSHLLRKTPEQADEEAKENPSSFRIAIDERNNFQLADGIVYVCEPMKRLVGGEFNLTQPSIVLPSFLPREFQRIDFMEWRGGLVYEGRVDTPTELPDKWRSFFRYSDYTDLAKHAKAIGLDFHVYTTRQDEEVRKHYNDICFLHEPLSIGKLIKSLGCHDWGLVGNLAPHEEWKNALPNKLFEYIAGCLPVVALHAEESARWVEEYDLGIVVGSLEELCERWKEHRSKRATLIKARRALVMEEHIHKLEGLYKELLTHA